MTDVAWFIATLKAEIPLRMVTRGLSDDGGPDLAHALEAYILDGEHHEHCPQECRRDHWRRIADDIDLFRDRYERPMKRALGILSRRPVPKGRPRLDIVLWCLARHDGNADMAIAALRLEYEFMWKRQAAQMWLGHALYELRTAYREDVPARVYGKSESQSIAEKAA